MKNVLHKILAMSFVALTVSPSVHAIINKEGQAKPVIIGPVRAAKCLFKPKQYNCTRNEIKQAKGWAITASVAAIVAALGVAMVVAPKINQSYQANMDVIKQDIINYFAVENEDLAGLVKETKYINALANCAWKYKNRLITMEDVTLCFHEQIGVAASEWQINGGIRTFKDYLRATYPRQF